MKSNLVISAIATAVAVFSQGAFAQASAPSSRAAVKAEASSGALAPPGQGPGERAGPTKNADSTKTRMERKDATKAAAAAGDLKKPGEAVQPVNPSASGAVTTRMERKDATKAAAAAGTLKPPGEAAMPVAEPKKK